MQDMMETTGKRNKKWFRHFFFSALAVQALWNSERQMNTGFMYGMSKPLDDIYPEKEDIDKKKDAYKRALQFFNCTPQFCSFVFGMSTAMEEEYAKNSENCVPDMITSLKTALMGPLSGMGDTFYQGVIRVIAFGIGVSLAQQGSLIGPVIAMSISIAASVPVTYYGGKFGYLNGKKILSDFRKNNVMEKIMYPLNILGLAVIGGMAASLVKIKTPLAYGEIFQLQTVLDSIMPGILPLAFTGFMCWRVKKGAKPMRMLFFCLVMGIVFKYFGIITT